MSWSCAGRSTRRPPPTGTSAAATPTSPGRARPWGPRRPDAPSPPRPDPPRAPGRAATIPRSRAASAAQVHPLVEARALDRTLDYAVPDALEDAVVPGALVACPLGPRRVLGVV